MLDWYRACGVHANTCRAARQTPPSSGPQHANTRTLGCAHRGRLAPRLPALPTARCPPLTAYTAARTPRHRSRIHDSLCSLTGRQLQHAMRRKDRAAGRRTPHGRLRAGTEAGGMQYTCQTYNRGMPPAVKPKSLTLLAPRNPPTHAANPFWTQHHPDSPVPHLPEPKYPPAPIESPSANATQPTRLGPNAFPVQLRAPPIACHPGRPTSHKPRCVLRGATSPSGIVCSGWPQHLYPLHPSRRSPGQAFEESILSSPVTMLPCPP